ncbi:SRPBCC family protein [Micromonospora sp. NPDC050417]|uniref:SRPBCC family protein n=1 Tax=Micromonospora sp. NPDC050417 TaxID=3364280 RepID=UPI0037A80F81
MDMVTGAHVAIALTVPVPRVRMWNLVTAVDRVAEWAPEAVDGGGWCDDVRSPTPGARFVGRNRFTNGWESTVTCVVVESEQPSVFAWTVLDDAGLVGSTWRYELHEGPEPGSTVVRHSFTHGPGASGARVDADADPLALNGRLVTLCRNMATTITAMAAADSRTGATR